MVTTHGLMLVACIVKGVKAEEAVENGDLCCIGE
jgi:hypothetical protein